MILIAPIERHLFYMHQCLHAIDAFMEVIKNDKVNS